MDYILENTMARGYITAYDLPNKLVDVLVHEDHFPVVAQIQCKGKQTQYDPVMKWANIDLEKLADPQIKERIEKQIDDIPLQPWYRTVDQHIAGLNSKLRKNVDGTYPTRPTDPTASR